MPLEIYNMINLNPVAQPVRADQADCAICKDGYSRSLKFACNMCSDSTSGIASAIVFALALFLEVLLAVSYLLSTELERGTKRALCRAPDAIHSNTIY